MADLPMNCPNNDRLNELERQVSEEIGRNELAHESYERRFSELKTASERQTEILVTMQRQADAIESVSDKVDRVVESVDNISERVSEIEKEPGDKFKKISAKVLEWAVLLVLGVVTGIVLKGYV